MFQVGDRVVAVVDWPEGNEEIVIGSEGVVCFLDGRRIGVRWDNITNGHDCHKTCDRPHGWNVFGTDIELAVVDDFDCGDEQDLDALLL
jgi:hypothetical protein